jgi:hypothetical protein
VTGHRRLVGIAIGATALAALGLLAGCGTGQVAETADTVPSVPGANLDLKVNGGLLSVRDATVDYSGPEGYRNGDNAPLTIRVVNGTTSPVTLSGAVAITKDGKASIGRVLQAGVTPSASGSPSASASESPSGTPSESPSPAPIGTATIKVPIPAAPDGLIILSKANTGGTYLVISGLTEALRPGQSVRMVLTFTLADGSTVQMGTSTVATQQLVVPVAVPASPAPRSPLATGAD